MKACLIMYPWVDDQSGQHKVRDLFKAVIMNGTHSCYQEIIRTLTKLVEIYHGCWPGIISPP